jgi:mersacidin/lichenicidin family type 2 lantibiotic
VGDLHPRSVGFRTPGGFSPTEFAPFFVTKVKEIPMSHENIVRAWKDLEYRLSLSAAERAQLPDHPAGLVELPEKELEPLAGGTGIYCAIVPYSNICTQYLTCFPGGTVYGP